MKRVLLAIIIMLTGANGYASDFHPTRKSEGLIQKSHPDNHPANPTYIVLPKIEHITETVDYSKLLTLEYAAQKSEFIGIAKLKGLKNSIAAFHITSIIKGPPLNKDIPVRVAQDLKVGDSYILIIEGAYPVAGAYETYKSSSGLLPASEENMGRLKEVVSKYNLGNQ